MSFTTHRVTHSSIASISAKTNGLPNDRWSNSHIGAYSRSFLPQVRNVPLLCVPASYIRLSRRKFVYEQRFLFLSFMTQCYTIHSKHRYPFTLLLYVSVAYLFLCPDWTNVVQQRCSGRDRRYTLFYSLPPQKVSYWCFSLIRIIQSS